jgi:flagellar hook assembly protein FlgD
VSAEDELSPSAIQLKAFPNPFSEQLTLLFSLKQRGRFSCEFYNIKGQKVRSLAEAPYHSGDHMLIWDGRDNSGNRLSSGIYFMQMHLDGELITTRKVILTK